MGRAVKRGGMFAIGVALGMLVALALAGEARAARYAVAQCGWYAGVNAQWLDTTGGGKFRPDAWCPSPGADPFDGAHVKALTRNAVSVSGNRFAGWRWSAPPGTGITQVRGTWWHALHDGMEQRLGSVGWNGAFNPFAIASTTDVGLRNFVAGFPAPVAAFESRLLCARAVSKWCSLEQPSWSSVRALTITVEDDGAPSAIVGGPLTAPGWKRGAVSVGFTASDAGAGVRFGETFVDGSRVNLTEYPCAKAYIGSQWEATQMQPCLTTVSGTAVVDTNAFSDGRHLAHHCAIDFAGNFACSGNLTVAIDNHAPSHLRNLTLAGGGGWRRSNDFDVSWENPDQGPASPLFGAYWRVYGPAGYDTGDQLAWRAAPSNLRGITVPHSGSYRLCVWLRDEAGNSDAGTAVCTPLLFDNVAPDVAFAGSKDDEDDGIPEEIHAQVEDADSGAAAGGTISYRRVNDPRWHELVTKTRPGAAPGSAELVAPTPEIDPGTYVFRVEARDHAGNTAATTRRADGSQMAIRKLPPVPPPPRAITRIFAWLDLHGRQRSELTVPFGAPATVAGHLEEADGDGLAGRVVHVVSRPSRGATAPVTVEDVRTGPHGEFGLALGPGPSRRVTVSFDGDGRYQGSARPSMMLRVRGAISLKVSRRRLRTGQRVVFSGRVEASGAPIPRRGKLVAIQYLERSTRRWRPVLVTRSGHRGRYRARYRFRYVKGRAAIRLRAVSLPEGRWPYARGASRALTVRVSGARRARGPQKRGGHGRRADD
jgi:hypothetical protein